MWSHLTGDGDRGRRAAGIGDGPNSSHSDELDGAASKSRGVWATKRDQLWDQLWDLLDRAIQIGRRIFSLQEAERQLFMALNSGQPVVRSGSQPCATFFCELAWQCSFFASRVCLPVAFRKFFIVLAQATM